MAKKNQFKENLKRELNELKFNFPALKEEDLFLLWFLRAYITDDNDLAVKAITNGPKDKGIDAIFIDDSAHSVFLVQSKFRHKNFKKNESRQDVMGFAQLTKILFEKDKKIFQDFNNDANSLVSDRMIEARKRLENRGYHLWLYYVTLGTCSTGLRKEAESTVHASSKNAAIEILSGRRLELLMRDYLDGVAPPIPTIDLIMESGFGISVNGIMQRYDGRSKIESWVFSMHGDSIAELYNKEGKRLFARNIRGFLGENTGVNKSMEFTLRKEPERFFYYNNGITLLCDAAQRVSFQGKDILRVSNPQIINGQQTTRTLAKKIDEAKKASVIVRVIQVPRNVSDNDNEFNSLLSQIVEGTNWQNQIRASDLISNDRRQIELQRELRKRGYLYIRKRESKTEASRFIGNKQYISIQKEEFARAVAGCDLDPVEARSGVENLFEDEKYRYIFPNSNPVYYLVRFWTMKAITSQAKGYPERAYAKWLTLNYFWSRLSDLIRSHPSQERYVHLMGHHEHELKKSMDKAINKVYMAVLDYWRLNRGRGARAIDVSTFFRNRRGLDTKFKSFWNGKHNKYKKSFTGELRKIAIALSIK